jgi:NAD-dependent deacetylase
MKAIEQLAQALQRCRSAVFFGGAGVSTESGIPDFRSVDGLYRQSYAYPPETILSRSFFDRNPEEFFRFYREKMLCLDAKPNPAHLALAQLEQEHRLRAVITQNIDGLHQRAGSREVLELHGSIHRNYCMECGRFYGPEIILQSQGIPRCSCGGIVKPDVVLYEESLDNDTVDRSVRHIAAADLLIIGGTSLAVYPAAGLIRYFGGGQLILINRDSTPMDSEATLVIHDSIGNVLSEAINSLR